jgi:hypothetical protein
MKKWDVSGWVGEIMEIEWLDSGLKVVACEEAEAIDSVLATITMWGRVVFADAHQVVIAQEVDAEGHGQYGVVWTPSVLRAVTLADSEDVVAAIIDEVESQEERPVSRRSTRRLG